MKRSVLFLLIMTIGLLSLAGCSKPETAGASTSPATTTPEQSTDVLCHFPPPLEFHSFEEFVEAVKDPDGYFERTKISYPKEALTNVEFFYLPTYTDKYEVQSIGATSVQTSVAISPVGEVPDYLRGSNVVFIHYCRHPDGGAAAIAEVAAYDGLTVDADGFLYVPEVECMYFPVEGGYVRLEVPDHLNTYEQIKPLCSVTKYTIPRDETSLVETAPEQDATPNKEPATTPEKEPAQTQADADSNQTEKAPPLTDANTFSHFNAIRQRLNLQEYVIFKGIKIKELPQDDVLEKPVVLFPVVLQVTAPLYGDVQPNSTLTLYENTGTYALGEDHLIQYDTNEYERVEENTEYIFILKRKSNGAVPDAYFAYDAVAYTHTKISDHASLAEKVKQGTASELEQFRYELLTYYREAPETGLDLYREAAKFVPELQPNATQEEILQALPQEQQALFNRMIQQYGIK